MPKTYVREIGAEKPYQKTGTINRHENTACPICSLQKLIPEKNCTCHTRQKPVPVFIGVNFYKAARLEPPPTLFKLLGFRASEPPNFLSHATPIMKLSSVQSDHQFRSNPAMEAASCKQLLQTASS